MDLYNCNSCTKCIQHKCTSIVLHVFKTNVLSTCTGSWCGLGLNRHNTNCSCI